MRTWVEDQAKPRLTNPLDVDVVFLVPLASGASKKPAA
jgi:hypothetical protein